MAKHPWLWQRVPGGPWYLRAKVPADLQGIFPKAEVKFSLKTRDCRDASRLIHEAAAQVQRLFDDYRQHGGPPPKRSSIVRYAKRYVPRYSGQGSPPADLRSSEDLSSSDIQDLALRYWAERSDWFLRPVLGLNA